MDNFESKSWIIGEWSYDTLYIIDNHSTISMIKMGINVLVKFTLHGSGH